MEDLDAVAPESPGIEVQSVDAELVELNSLSETPGRRRGNYAPKVVDWEAVRVHYRSNRMTLREIGRQFGVSDAGIIKHARKHGWERDLGAKVSKATQYVLARKTLPKGGIHTDDEIVAANAHANVAVIEGQRARIKQAMEVCGELMVQLQHVVVNRRSIEDTIRAECGPDGRSSGHKLRRAAMLKAVSLPQNATTLKDLSVATKNLVELQRQAYNLDTVTNDDSIESLLGKLRDQDDAVHQSIEHSG